MASSSWPVSETRLKQITNDACDSAFNKVAIYEHESTEQWNSTIINKILSSLISETKPDAETEPPFKFAVTSTIIQHLSDPPSTGSDGGASAQIGRRGMHSASGAYWNNDKDGMWSYKYEGGETKGMDVVVNLMWVAY